MTDTLVDTNILLDIADINSSWSQWSGRMAAEAADSGALVINQVIYSELVAGYSTREQLDAAVDPDRFRRETLPWDAAYLAGLAFLKYRRRGGHRSSPLPDFYIGAHASVRGYRLLTRDRGYYVSYFPAIDIVSPETHP